MKTRAWMLCCLGLLVPLSFAGAEEQPQGSLKITVGIEGEGLERIPVVGPLLKHFAEAQKKVCDEQEQVKLPPPPQAPVMAATTRSVPLLSDLPYVGQLFRDVVVGPVEACETAECPACPAEPTIRFVGPDGLKRIGVDFDCAVAEVCAPCQAQRGAPVNVTRAVSACPTTTCPTPMGVAISPEGPCAGGVCEVLPAPFAMVQACEVEGVADRDELIQALLEARVEAAVAQTALKVREESRAEQLELIKELVTSQVENAKLTAKLELAAEKEKMLAQLIEAHVELATLKAQVARDSEVASRKRQRKDAEARRPVEAVEALR